VKARPDEFDESLLVPSLAEGWGLAVEAAEYAALGAGSYHWVVADSAGRRSFVTVDDLDHKPWLGATRDSALEGLRCAFDTAAALAGSGLRFVVAPIPTVGGESLRRIGARHTIALFAFVDARASSDGRYGSREERCNVIRMLADLHRSTPVAATFLRKEEIALPGRTHLESAFDELDQTWVGGPFSEPARRAFARHAADVTRLLKVFDHLAAHVASSTKDWVVTHGEPHARNVLKGETELLLIDWDTVALAPPERDLWMVVSESGDEAALYANATGHQADQTAINFYGIAWDLKDLTEYLNVLRSPHLENEDTANAYRGLTRTADVRKRWSSLLG
jgi:spectinomycin phosphotransferase